MLAASQVRSSSCGPIIPSSYEIDSTSCRNEKEEHACARAKCRDRAIIAIGQSRSQSRRSESPQTDATLGRTTADGWACELQPRRAATWRSCWRGSGTPCAARFWALRTPPPRAPRPVDVARAARYRYSTYYFIISVIELAQSPAACTVGLHEAPRRVAIPWRFGAV